MLQRCTCTLGSPSPPQPCGTGGQGWALAGKTEGELPSWQLGEQSGITAPATALAVAEHEFLMQPPWQSLPGSQESRMLQLEKEATYTMIMEVVHRVSGFVLPLQT